VRETWRNSRSRRHRSIIKRDQIKGREREEARANIAKRGYSYLGGKDIISVIAVKREEKHSPSSSTRRGCQGGPNGGCRLVSARERDRRIKDAAADLSQMSQKSQSKLREEAVTGAKSSKQRRETKHTVPPVPFWRTRTTNRSALCAVNAIGGSDRTRARPRARKTGPRKNLCISPRKLRRHALLRP